MTVEPDRVRRARGVVLVVMVVVLALASFLGDAIVGPSGSRVAQAADTERPVQRVLVFSLPHVTWADLDRYDLPAINRFLDDAAVAGLTTRADSRSTKLADGYLTLGAGTRTVGDPQTDGDVLGVDEVFGDNTAAEVFAQRTGRDVSTGIVALAMPRVVETNDSLLYDSEPGALAVALRDAGIDRGVVANGDGRQPDSPPSPNVSVLRRQAGLALVDPKGRIPGGRVDAGLLEADPNAPFGLRTDLDAMSAAFESAWASPRAVVLVEASDLVREDLYRTYSTPFHRDALLRRALTRSDALLARLLAEVDPRTDAVVIVGPAHAAREINLTVLGVQAPSIDPGLLRSATTRRSGFVQLIDVAPTILDLLGVDRPSSMEGRAVEVGSTGGSARDRRDTIVHASDAAMFRDRIVGSVQAASVIFSAALVVGVVLLFGEGRVPSPARRRAWRTHLGTVALCVLGFVAAVFLGRLVPLHEVGVVGFWAFLVGVAVALGLLYRRIGRTRPIDGLITALLVPAGVLLVDVVLGTPLQFNSPLGYSPTVAGRFIGFSNPAYAAAAACVVVAAPLLALRLQERRGGRTPDTGLAEGSAAWIPIGLLAVVIVVDGAPFWGSDVGGILSMVPAFAITALLVLGMRVRLRAVLWCVVGLAVALAGFAALDLSRPAQRRTHLGRLVERIDERGIGDFIVVVQRKLADNLGSLRHSIWGFMLLVALALAVWLYRRAPERVPDLFRRLPAIRVSAIGLGIVAVLGYLLNDSGVAIPGVMLVVGLASLVWLLCRFDPDAAPAGTERAPQTRPVGAVRR
ncbi:MAG TPA: hypothetical protein VFW06_00075 [Acidimicrobiia bacterium]|nr:hypothetical protein [Acidimicrobiia bacterium]